MNLKHGIISAVAGTSLLGGVAALVASPSSPAAPPAVPAAVSLAAATTSASQTASTSDCSTRDDGNWPAFATGQPAGFDAGSPGGVYLWHDESGWHLRVTHRNDTHQVYSGVLTTSGTFSDVDAVKLEKDDHFEVGPRDHRITFRFQNYGGIDGIDFRTHCAPRVTFELKADGQELQTFQVHIGHGGDNPTSVPFTIERAR